MTMTREEALSSLATLEDGFGHYGVPGMKWGVRKGDGPPSTKLASTAQVVGTTARATAATGAFMAGRVLGGAAGTAVLGPAGSGLGAVAGGYAVGIPASKLIYAGQNRRRESEIKEAKTTKIHANQNSKYTDKQVVSDVRAFGKLGSTRINNSMNAGESRKAALQKERSFNTKMQLTALGTSLVAAIAGPRMVKTKTADLKQGIQNKAAANRTAATNAGNRANKMGLPKGPLQPKMGRDGFTKITTLR